MWPAVRLATNASLCQHPQTSTNTSKQNQHRTQRSGRWRGSRRTIVLHDKTAQTGPQPPLKFHQTRRILGARKTVGRSEPTHRSACFTVTNKCTWVRAKTVCQMLSNHCCANSEGCVRQRHELRNVSDSPEVLLCRTFSKAATPASYNLLSNTVSSSILSWV